MSTPQGRLETELGEFFAQVHRTSATDSPQQAEQRRYLVMKAIELFSDHSVPAMLMKRLTEPVLMPGDLVQVQIDDHSGNGVGVAVYGKVTRAGGAGGPLIVKITEGLNVAVGG